MKLATCLGCACDDNHACIADNSARAYQWVRLDRAEGLGVCSACPGSDVSRWDAGDRQIRALKTISGNWGHFERLDIAPDAPDVQRQEMKRAFIAGAGSVLLLWSWTLGTPNPRKTLQELREELTQFRKFSGAGLARCRKCGWAGSPELLLDGEACPRCRLVL